MRRLARIAATAGLVTLAVAPVPAAAAETCRGEKVTISFRDPGVGDRIVGTAGRDVIQGGPRAERILGGGGDDVICGGDGGDTINGGLGRDELAGQDGSDVFIAGTAALLAEDIVIGGEGSPDRDIADYRSSPVGIRLDMTRGIVLGDGARARGGILGIERVEGTDHDDELIGNAARTTLVGWDGNDFIDGRGGNDRLFGADGVDTVSYEHAREGIRLSVEGQDVFVGPGRENKDEVYEFEIYIGSKFADRLVGGDHSEKLVGGPGDDTLKGFGDGDTLEGGPGDDTIYPGEGDDLVNGGTNDPVTGTGAHGDLVSYQDETPHGLSGSFDFEAHMLPDEHFGTPPEAIGVGEDPLIGIESVRAPQKGMSELEGDNGPNVLIGSSRIDVILGNGGNDLLFGLGSNDSIEGGDGDDLLDGGEPHTDGDSDKLDGGDGNDTCLGAREEFRAGCETIG
jgi:Ca2+-binding RTX toxin-like protein